MIKAKIKDEIMELLLNLEVQVDILDRGLDIYLGALKLGLDSFIATSVAMFLTEFIVGLNAGGTSLP